MSMVSLKSEGDTAGARLWLERIRERGLAGEQDDFTLADLGLIVMRPDRPGGAADGASVLQQLRQQGRRLENQFRYTPLSLLSGVARSRMGDAAGARAAFDSARAELEALIAGDPEEPRYRSSLGLALAGLGRSEEAIREGREGVRLMPPEVEAWRGAYRVTDLARIYAMTGRVDEAIEQLEWVMSIPADLSAWDLRLDPTWDALRGDPRFEALTAAD
jgi:tetratricopeptide (TPR) repeat protein